MTVPYTYLLKHVSTGKKLYLNELGQKKFCFPGTEPAGFE